jgi:alpha-D-ribose 1-methylphosphonate 5-triphosphate synthase subunit PhnH
MLQAIVPGFSDPVREQQRTFRAVMDALARPAQPVTYVAPLEGQSPLSPVAFAIALTLLDFEVRYHLAPSLKPAAEAITFHTGSVQSDARDQAEFAFVDLRHDALDLAGYAQGDPEYPDRSTTVVAYVSSAAHGRRLLCRGPGLAQETELCLSDLPADFLSQWQANTERAPLGVDLLFVTAEAVIGLPRSTRIIEEAR